MSNPTTTSTRTSFGKALSSIFGAAATVATTSAKVVEDTASGFDMLSSFIDNEKAKQAIRHDIDRQTYGDRAYSEAAQEITAREAELTEIFREKPEIKAMYDKNLANLLANRKDIPTK